MFGDEGSLPPIWNEARVKEWAFRFHPPRDWQKAAQYAAQNMLDPDGSLMLGDLEQAGVDAAVIMGLDYGLGCRQEQSTPVEEVERFNAELQKKYPGKFYAFFGMDPRRKGSLELFEIAIKEWGMKGLKLYPPNGYYAHDEVCLPFYEKCLEFGVPVTFHTSPSPPPLNTRFNHPMNIAEVQSKYPDLAIIHAHTGYPCWWDVVLGMAYRHPFSYLEVSNWAEEAYRDPGGFIARLARARDMVGTHRILFASDRNSGPRFSGEKYSTLPKWVQFFRDLPDTAKQYGFTFTQEEVDLILGGNAARILGL